ncbi:dihydrolipoamide dehydrogenase [Aequitasia blattaphilus]|uniref:Dihydrolipoyl dehydrogenase n=1 Tax=Aequitasia blattaphilus TaxID=2949332 RepID=A0ABT1EDB0_9FIRM|nr:dihydrolipoyl dehydrogenase [Aequitasia blattaphilus]MCP1102947.1 dihydrolipoyl dehydrogenase [Aequitasia blattaphilus]MCR8615587.1 dihydrolipoyl dehydrogenase [Aequitasia blattaphilus]
MAEVIIMPKLGFNMDEGELVKWHKQVGDQVAKGEVLFEINTDKTTMPVEATCAGTVLKIMLSEGEAAEVFTPIAVVGEAGENPENVLGTEVKAEEEAEPAKEIIEEKSGYDYDVIVIGAGPGGYETAIKAAQLGKKTAIVEAKHFGGVCLNEGCIPTKTLIRTANLYSEVKEAEQFGVMGIDVSKVKVDMEKLQQRKQSVVHTLVSGVEGLLRRNKVTILNGIGAFKDEHTVCVEEKEYTSENFIIATGSNVFMPPFIPLEGDTNVITSKEALDMKELPKTIAIIGGGVIGIEFAHVFSHLGVKVTVLELMENILPMVDEEVSGMVKTRMEKNGVVFYNSAKVQKVKDKSVMYELDGKELSVEADVVLMAVGRVANTEGLNAEGIGIEFDRKAIAVNDYMQTNIPHIYAIGDVNGKVMLAHTASHEGFVAVEHICGGHHQMSYERIPSCIYLDPEVASIGLTEKQAKEKGYDINIGRFPMMANGKSLVEGDSDGLVKIIIEKELGEILGVHLYGKHVTDMIGEIAVAMELEATAEEVLQAIHPHPTVSEAIGEGFMSAFYGKAINC